MPFSNVKLKTVADLQSGMPTVGPRTRPEAGTIPLVTVRAIRSGQLDPSALYALNDDLTFEPVDRYLIEPYDLLIPARSTSLQAAIVPAGLAGAIFNATLIRVRCDRHRLAPALLKAYLDHPEGRAQVEAVTQSGTHQMNVTVSALGEIEIPLPPISEQASLVATIEAAERAYAAGIAAANSRRNVALNIVIRKMHGEPRRVGVHS